MNYMVEFGFTMSSVSVSGTPAAIVRKLREARRSVRASRDLLGHANAERMEATIKDALKKANALYRATPKRRRRRRIR